MDSNSWVYNLSEHVHSKQTALCPASNRDARNSGRYLHDVIHCGLLIQQQLFIRRGLWLLTEAWCLSSLKVKSRAEWIQALLLSLFCNFLQPAGTISLAPSQFPQDHPLATHMHLPYPIFLDSSIHRDQALHSLHLRHLLRFGMFKRPEKGNG